MSNVSSRVGFDVERSLSAVSFDGTYQYIGSSLTENPIIIVFDNQTDVAVPLSVDGANTWKTFSSGEALVLDLRANNGIAATYTMEIGTRFSTNASVGTSGNFRISITYAR
jgi:hypothetical protein